MFYKDDSNKYTEAIEQLAAAYAIYEKAQWRYPIDAGIGGRLIETCLLNPDRLKKILCVIGQGLFGMLGNDDVAKKNNIEKANLACLLFDKLYKDDFIIIALSLSENNLRKFYYQKILKI